MVLALLLTFSYESIARWKIVESNSDRALIGVYGNSNNDVFAVGTGETIVHFDGASWTKHYPGSSPIYYPDVWSSSETDVFAVGSLGKIIHYDGVSWSEMNSGTTADLKDVWGSSSIDIFAVGKFGTIIHYDGNNEGKWELMGIGTSIPNFYGVWGSSGIDVYATSSGGIIYHYDGIAWKLMKSGTSLGIESIWGSSESEIFAVGADGLIIRYDGIEWSTVDGETTERLYDVWCSENFECFATGFNGVTLYYNGYKWTKTTKKTDDRLYGVWGSRGGKVFAVGYNGTIMTTNIVSFSCNGFDAPCNEELISVNKNKCIPLRAQLFDKDGNEITDSDIENYPTLILVNFDPTTSSANSIMIKGLPDSKETEGNQFIYTGKNWMYNLKISNYTAPGTYTFGVETSDDNEYVIDPSCKIKILVR